MKEIGISSWKCGRNPSAITILALKNLLYWLFDGATVKNVLMLRGWATPSNGETLFFCKETYLPNNRVLCFMLKEKEEEKGKAVPFCDAAIKQCWATPSRDFVKTETRLVSFISYTYTCRDLYCYQILTCLSNNTVPSVLIYLLCQPTNDPRTKWERENFAT